MRQWQVEKTRRRGEKKEKSERNEKSERDEKSGRDEKSERGDGNKTESNAREDDGEEAARAAFSGGDLDNIGGHRWGRWWGGLQGSDAVTTLASAGQCALAGNSARRH